MTTRLLVSLICDPLRRHMHTGEFPALFLCLPCLTSALTNLTLLCFFLLCRFDSCFHSVPFFVQLSFSLLSESLHLSSFSQFFLSSSAFLQLLTSLVFCLCFSHNLFICHTPSLYCLLSLCFSNP